MSTNEYEIDLSEFDNVLQKPKEQTYTIATTMITLPEVTMTGVKVVKQLKTKKEAHERIEGACLPYFDYDLGAESEMFPTDDEYTAFCVRAVEHIQSVLKERYGTGIKLYIFDGSRKGKKISFHFIVRGGGCYPVSINIKNELNNGLCEKFQEFADGIDLKPYKKEGKRQLFRLPYSNKTSYNKKTKVVTLVKRMLKRCKLVRGKIVKSSNIDSAFKKYGESIDEWMITNVAGEELIEVPIVVPNVSVTKRTFAKMSNATASVSPDILIGLGLTGNECLTPFDGGWSIQRCGDRECVVSGNHHDGTNGMFIYNNNGIWNLRCQSEKCKGESVEYCDVKYNIEEDYNWTAFAKKLKTTVFSSKQKAMTYLALNVPRVLARINVGEEFFFKKDNKNECLSQVSMSKFNRLMTRRVIRYMNEGEQRVSLELSKIIDDYTPEYTSIVNDPTGRNKEAFNIWRGFKATRVNYDEADERLVLFNKVFGDVCGDMFEYIKKWFAFLVKRPEEIPGTCLFITGEQGTGKNCLLDLISKYVVGDYLYATYSNIEKLTGEFNGYIAGKKFCLVNEASATKEAYLKNFNKMKHYITDDRISINPKGKSEFTVDNKMGIAILSNHEHALYLEKSDRRYACVKTSSVYKGNKALWEKVVNTLHTPEFGDVLYSYLLDIEVKKTDIISIPDSTFKNELIEQSFANPLRFIKEMKEAVDSKEDCDGYAIIEARNSLKKRRIKRGVLYDFYADWCGECRERVFPKRVFLKMVEGSKYVKTIKSNGMRVFEF